MERKELEVLKKSVVASTWTGKNHSSIIDFPLIKIAHFKYCKEFTIEKLEC